MKKVLVIEDNSDNMELITFILENYGCQTVKAYNGSEGVELAEQTIPDVIIVDYMLPDMNGRDVARKIKALNREKVPPMICMTALAMPGDRENILSSGFSGYIEKPIDPGSVIDEINQIVGGSLEDIRS